MQGHVQQKINLVWPYLGTLLMMLIVREMYVANSQMYVASSQMYVASSQMYVASSHMVSRLLKG